ncbi:hypothetical protein ACIHEJ_34745 [Streptomyces sp. NPDC052301]
MGEQVISVFRTWCPLRKLQCSTGRIAGNVEAHSGCAVRAENDLTGGA